VGKARQHRDVVILRSRKDANSEVLQLPRGVPDERRHDLEADGWTCQTIEIDPPDPPS